MTRHDPDLLPRASPMLPRNVGMYAGEAFKEGRHDQNHKACRRCLES